MTSRFVHQLHRFISTHALIEQDDRVVVAVSGGTDSLALLYGLHALQTQLNCSLHIAHLNHCIRPDSNTDAKFVQQHAKRLALPFTLRTVDVRQTLNPQKSSLEAAGRAARYEFYEVLSRQIDATKVALGHHQDDTAETVLMNLLRGAGPSGLKGIAPIRDGPDSTHKQGAVKTERTVTPPLIIRPLAGFTRQDIETFLNSIGIKPLHDATNTDKRYLRNRIRHELIPLLERNYNPNIKTGLNRTAEVLKSESEYLDTVAHDGFEACQLQSIHSKPEHPQHENTIVLDREKFCQYHIALQRRILRHAVTVLQGQLNDFYFQHYQAILDVVSGDTPNAVLALPNGSQFRRTYQQLIFEVNLDNRRKDFTYPIAISGKTFIPALNANITANVVELSPPDIFPIPDGTFTAVFDWDTIQLPLIIRNRQPGDRFQPYGMNGTKKLKDFFIDAKLPLYEREHLPLLVSGDEILWVIGYTTNERTKVHDSTQRYLHLQYTLKDSC